MTAPDGLLIVDKPQDWTSHDVVGRTRRLAQTRKVGHAGTLDPMATGVLVLGIGRATRLLTFLVGCDKAYTATVRLGQATLTDDAQGEVTASADATGITDADVRSAAARLTGAIEQVPSAVSAIKVKGERSYARVRAGEQVDLPARRVTVSRFQCGPLRPVPLVTEAGDRLTVVDLDVEVEVSSGTYVRALARDLGADLGVGGHLTALRRTRVGHFTLGDATPLAELTAAVEAGGELPVVPLAAAAARAFAVRRLTREEATAVGHGQRVEAAEAGRTEPVAAIGPDGRLVALLDETRPVARTHVVFAPGGS